MKDTQFIPEELTLLEKTPLSSAYAETFVFTPANSGEANLGNLFIIAEITSNKTKKENAALAAELASALKNEYFKNTIVTPLSALKFALKRANNVLKLKKQWLNPQISLKIKIIVAALKENRLHLARLGDASALILRNNSLQNIVTPAPSLATFDAAANLSFENITSGELMPEDRIVLATNQIHKISEDDLIYQLRERGLAKYLKRSGAGLKNLAVVALYPKKTSPLSPLAPIMPPLIEKPNRIYMSNKSYRSYKKPIILVLVLLAVLTTVAVVAVKIKSETARNKIEAETLVAEATELKDKIASLLEVKNETEANELLISAEAKLKRLEELKLFKTTRATLQQDLKKIAAGLEHIENISGVRKIIDLENNSAGFDPLALALGRNKILTFSGPTLYRFDLNRRSGNFESLEEGAAIVAALEKPDDPNALLVITQDKIALDSGSPDSITLWIRPDNIPTLAQAAIYREAFYLLATDGLIYKLPFTVSSSSDLILGETEIWTNQAPTTNYKLLTTNLALDGSIFGLTDEHTLVELENGAKKKQIALRENVAKIFTSSSHKNIYALAASEGLIIVLDKELNIKKRLSHNELAGAKSFIVNSQERIIYFLKGKTVYSFEI